MDAAVTQMQAEQAAAQQQARQESRARERMLRQELDRMGAEHNFVLEGVTGQLGHTRGLYEESQDRIREQQGTIEEQAEQLLRLQEQFKQIRVERDMALKQAEQAAELEAYKTAAFRRK